MTSVNMDGRNPKVWNILAKELYGRVLADRGYIPPMCDRLFDNGVYFVTEIKAHLKNKLMPLGGQNHAGEAIHH